MRPAELTDILRPWEWLREDPLADGWEGTETMAWKLSGELYQACSCKMLCGCTLGPAEPDQGWCSTAFVLDVQDGESDGMDLSGCRIAIGLELPGDFLGGIEKARLYVDADDQQRSEIEAIFTGQRGGLWAGLNQAVGEWLPPKSAAITISRGGAPRIEVAGGGELALEPVQTEAGDQAQLVNAPLATSALGLQTLNLHTANGSTWRDPDLRQWESLGYGTRQPFSWS